MTKDDWPKEKRWKLVYTRSEKLSRAKQLGFEYPRKPVSTAIDLAPEPSGERRNVLFLCSRNQWRSPTAEHVWRRHPAISVRSAGTSVGAKRKVSADDVRWADVIFVMEEKHKSRLLAAFPRSMLGKPIHVLDIPDAYAYMDPELVELLEAAVGAVLGIRR